MTITEMPIEREIKLRVSSHDPVRGSLHKLDATFLHTALEINWILDRPDGSLRRAGCGLRVRMAKTADGHVKSSITYKGPVQVANAKTREELEIVVGEAETALRIFNSLGYDVILQYEKRRESWALGECRVELDEPARLGLFVEVEGESDAAIDTVRTKLGLRQAETVRSSYVRLLVEYCEANNMRERIVRF